MSSKQITLRNKIKLVGGTETNKITMREPTRGDLKAVESVTGGDIEKEDFLLSSLTGISVDALDDLVLSDSAKLTAALTEMTQEGYSPKP